MRKVIEYTLWTICSAAILGFLGAVDAGFGAYLALGIVIAASGYGAAKIGGLRCNL